PASLYPAPTTSDLPRYVELTTGILRVSRARAIIASDSMAETFEAVRPSCPDLSLVLARGSLDAAPGPIDARPSIDDLAFVQFTSGSTSAPKGVALTHGNLCANVNAINGPQGLATTPEDVGVSWLPLYHDMGLVGMTFGPMYTGRPGVLLMTQMFIKRPAEW